MSKIIYVNNIPITIEYRKVKNINLYIKPPDAHVLITAPRQAAESRIREFAEGRAQWIEKSRKRMLDSREKMADELSGAITKEQMERITEMVEAYARKWEPVMGALSQRTERMGMRRTRLSLQRIQKTSRMD